MLLVEIAEQQSSWSKTANALKRQIEIARWTTSVLSVAGALFATIASQLDQSQPRLYLAISGSVVLATVSFIAARLIDGSHLTKWIRARAASEALKAAAYKYAAGVSPYEDSLNRDTLLNRERNRIEEEVNDLSILQVVSDCIGSSPRADLTRDQYVKLRIQVQIKEFYGPKAEAYRQAARRLRIAEFVLALLATVVTAVIGVAGKEALGIKFDFVSVTAVLTTVGSAILAHIEASRYEFLTIAYRSAARHLANELACVNDLNAFSPIEWSAFVNRCESVIAQENSSWIAKWSEPKP